MSKNQRTFTNSCKGCANEYVNTHLKTRESFSRWKFTKPCNECLNGVGTSKYHLYKPIFLGERE